jgi:hypothetical protein
MCWVSWLPSSFEPATLVQVASILGRVVMADDIHLSDKGGILVLKLVAPFLEKTLILED